MVNNPREKDKIGVGGGPKVTTSRPSYTKLDNTVSKDRKKILHHLLRRCEEKFSRLKIIVSNNIIEVYEGERAVRINDHRPKPRKNENKEKEDRSEENRERALSIAKNNIYRLILCNFTMNSKFITLTFKECITDIAVANREFKIFIQRLRRRYGKFKYITVIEFQKRGAIHYHMISSLSYTPNNVLIDIWGNGFIRINNIENIDKVASYISKYITKHNKDKRLIGHKSYFCSRGLERPRIYRGSEAEFYAIKSGIQNCEPSYSKDYNNTYDDSIIHYFKYDMDKINAEVREAIKELLEL